jgi:hypothetical protein
MNKVKCKINLKEADLDKKIEKGAYPQVHLLRAPQTHRQIQVLTPNQMQVKKK